MILSRYPDYGKAPPEYLAGIAELLSSFPADVLRTMTDNHIGISAKHKFLPTQADFIEYADALAERRHNMRDLRKGRVAEPVGAGVKLEPFPSLWAAFRDMPELLQRDFEALAGASKALALDGRDAAEQMLRAHRGQRAA